SFTNWTETPDDGSLSCLLNAFEQITAKSCFVSQSFGIDFQNIAFEIYIPMKNESKFQFNQIIVDRTSVNQESFLVNSPMMFIDTKISNTKNKSFILIEQENYLSPIQTANVTVIFNHQVSLSII
ncbi:unnamed protein product, partial [Rotaria magnacalcarata]